MDPEREHEAERAREFEGPMRHERETDWHVHTHEWKREHRSHWSKLAAKLVATLIIMGAVGGIVYLLIVLVRNAYGKPVFCTLKDMKKKLSGLIESNSNMFKEWDSDTGEVTAADGKANVVGSNFDLSVQSQMGSGIPSNPDVTFFDQAGKGCVFFKTDEHLCLPRQTGGNQMAYAITSDMAADPSTDMQTKAANLCGVPCADRQFWIALMAQEAIPQCSCLCGPKKK